MNPMIAYCGLDCSSCPIHLATLEPDPHKQQSMKSDIVRMGAELYKVHLTIEDITDCDGCRTGSRLYSGCSNCEIRKCAVNRRLDSCAFCEDYNCDLLQKHFMTDPDSRKRLEAMRTA